MNKEELINNVLENYISDFEKIIVEKKYTIVDFEKIAKKILTSSEPEKYFKDFSVLHIKDIDNQISLAHVLAFYGYVIKDFSTLKIRDFNGLSVAHYVATKQPNDFDFKYLTKEERNYIIAIKDQQGSTVAHCMALIGHKFNEETESHILEYKDFHNRSVAHFMALNKKANDIKSTKILSMKDNNGISVLDLINTEIEK